LRRYEVATAAVIMLIAAVAMYDTRRGALPDLTGVAPGGLGAGFYPFWSAGFVFVFGALVIWRSLVVPQPAQGVFKDRHSVTSVLWIVLPIIAAVGLMGYLGVYAITALYMGFFAAVIGRYRWYWVILIAVVFPLGLYLLFELGFRVGLPKSELYDLGLAPF
jgi:tripartite tricarboxylate transporter TctB family protein